MSTNIDESKSGNIEAPISSSGDRSPWIGIVIIAVVVAFTGSIGLNAWHAHIHGPEYSTVAEIQNQGKVNDACFAANPNSITAATQCEKDNSPGSPSYPWPTTHVWLSTVLVFIGVLVIGRLYVFMRRMKDKAP